MSTAISAARIHRCDPAVSPHLDLGSTGDIEKTAKPKFDVRCEHISTRLLCCYFLAGSSVLAKEKVRLKTGEKKRKGEGHGSISIFIIQNKSRGCRKMLA